MLKTCFSFYVNIVFSLFQPCDMWCFFIKEMEQLQWATKSPLIHRLLAHSASKWVLLSRNKNLPSSLGFHLFMSWLFWTNHKKFNKIKVSFCVRGEKIVHSGKFYIYWAINLVFVCYLFCSFLHTPIAYLWIVNCVFWQIK